MQILEIDGVCGIHIDGNILKYGKYDREAIKIVNGVEQKGDFREAGTVKLSGARITVPFIKNGKAEEKTRFSRSPKTAAGYFLFTLTYLLCKTPFLKVYILLGFSPFLCVETFRYL